MPSAAPRYRPFAKGGHHRKGMEAFFPSLNVDFLRDAANQSVTNAGQIVQNAFNEFEIGIVLPNPVVEGTIVRYLHDGSLLETYYFHTDHLGSSNYITNLAGIVTQHLEYLPFGEMLVEEHLNSNNEPFKFNGKELDEETGNYYYGARYYNPKWSIWLSVDPLAEKYPGWSPYNYTMNNPVRYTDPTGMTVESPDNDYGYDTETGKLTLLKLTNDKFDEIFTGEFNKNGDFSKDGESIKIDKGALFGTEGQDLSLDGIVFRNLEDGLQTMKFLSFKDKREFNGWGFKNSKGEKGLFLNPWKYNTSKSAVDLLLNKGERVGLLGSLGSKIFKIHTHPGTKEGYGFGYPSPADKRNVGFNKEYPHYILSRHHGVTRYNERSTYTVNDLDKYFK